MADFTGPYYPRPGDSDNALYRKILNVLVLLVAAAPIPTPPSPVPPGPDNVELREDGGFELREDGGYELRE